MIPLSFDDIDATAIRSFIESGRTEDQTIEYKSAFPGNADSEKIPWLLKPVCSFANSEGGDLLLGIRAEGGVPVEAVGCSFVDADAAILSAQQMIQAGIDPLVRSVQIKILRVGETTDVMLVRVAKSWTAPHRVRNNRMFYARGAAGAYELDVPQLRQSFLMSEGAQREMQAFRTDRIAKIIARSTPVPVSSGLTMVVHVLPLQSFTNRIVLSATEYETRWQQIAPPDSGGLSRNLGMDGLTVYEVSGREESGAYSLLFREGRMEFVQVFEPSGEQSYLPSIWYERVCIEMTSQAIRFLRSFGFEAPMYIGFSLLNSKGKSLGVSNSIRFYRDLNLRPFDREHMVFNDVELNDLDVNLGRSLRPIFDHVWNAVGMTGSLNYTDDGDWTENRQR